MDMRNFTLSAVDESSNEAEIYQRLSTLTASPQSRLYEDLRTTPLLTLAVKESVEADSKSLNIETESLVVEKQFPQYAIVGFHTGEHRDIRRHEPILMNVDAPNSTFISGSQGSGKSYTLSCMMENCLFADRRIGHISTPVAGVAFHYDPDSIAAVAEIAHLCSIGIPVKVLVSQSNEYALRKAYSRLPGAETHLTIAPLLLHSSHLSVERMQRLMAFADRDGPMPLYMSVALRVLRRMAIETREEGFNYEGFKAALRTENLTKEQFGPLNLRLELLESFLDLDKRRRTTQSSQSHLDVQSGTWTIVDLTDPFMDPATVCILFDICLSVFKDRRPPCGLVVALDEAHKYMTSSPGASNFTERLLGTIREQRHNATRVIIATQEPTVSEKLLDLCTVSIIHRFTSPAWFTSIRNHLGAASKLTLPTSEYDTMFTRIMNLGVGESLVFAPSAFLCLTETGAIGKLGCMAIDMKTRTRIGSDGGMSMLASTQTVICSNERSGKSSHAQSTDAAVYDSNFRVDRVATGIQHTQNGPKEMALSTQLEDPVLERSGSHLMLICCSCEQAVLIEFHECFLPDVVSFGQRNVRAGVAYATCVGCAALNIRGTKTALKKFDFVRAKEFQTGTFTINEDYRNHLRTGVKPILGRDIIVLVRDSKILYLYLRVVQRAIKNETLLWTVRSNREKEDSRTARLSAHQDGIFFDFSS